ncbi:MAG: SGNH/GDSL hydrolase family protein [Planctomycetota bacterium]|nr:SGNH/GDSL hydrolase family protein [Planctomycetota bacterium]
MGEHLLREMADISGSTLGLAIGLAGSDWALAALIGIPVVSLVLAECVARFVLGLGNPALTQADETIKYLNAPNDRARRKGIRQTTNEWGMRSPAFSRRKTDPRERRILVIGDSVVHGGAHCDDAQIATALLQADLSHDGQSPVVVANIAAGGWCPPNQAAYLAKFGTFDADLAILVLNSEDAVDINIDYTPHLRRDVFTMRKPLLALQEIYDRKIYPRLFPSRIPHFPATTDRYTEADAVARSLAALRQMITQCRSAGVRVAALQHWKRAEIETGKLDRGHTLLKDVLDELDVPTLQGNASFHAAMQRGEPMYRDAIHPTTEGQRVLAADLARIAREQLGLRPHGA